MIYFIAFSNLSIPNEIRLADNQPGKQVS